MTDFLQILDLTYRVDIDAIAESRVVDVNFELLDCHQRGWIGFDVA